MLLQDILEIRVLKVPTHTHTHKIKSLGKIIKPAKMNREASQFSFNYFNQCSYAAEIDPLHFPPGTTSLEFCGGAVSLFHGVSLV